MPFDKRHSNTKKRAIEARRKRFRKRKTMRRRKK